jgi:hypothetical protein
MPKQNEKKNSGGSLSSSKQRRDRQSASTGGARSQADRAGRLSSIYVIRIGDRYKIGLSVNPVQRIGQMMLPAKPDVVLIFRCKKASELEATLHRKYAAKREHGEWFLLEKPQIAEIHRVCEEWKKQVE